MKLAYYRNLWKMTQRDVSMLSGLSVRQIRDLENGHVDMRKIRADTAIRLAKCFGISVEELMGVCGSWDDGSIIYDSDFISS